MLSEKHIEKKTSILIMNQSRFWWRGYTRCYASSYNQRVTVLFCWFELDFVNHVFIHQVIVVLKLYIRKLSLNVSEVLFAMNETKNMFHCTCTSIIIYIHITSKQNPRKLYLNIKHQAVTQLFILSGALECNLGL